MTTPQVQNDPIYNLGLSYINGLIVSNNATTPNTKLDISAGMCRDSNNIMDIVLGANNPNLEGVVEAAPLTINAAVNGANGLDTGSLAASTVYAVYIIADSRYYNKASGILTLASNTSPLLPFGYDSLRLIGYAITDASSHFQLMNIFGNGGFRILNFAAPLAVTTVSSTSYAGVDLSTFAPAIDGMPLNMYVNFNANAAADNYKAKPYNAANDNYILVAPVAGATAHTTQQFFVLGNVVSGGLQIKCLVSAGSAALFINGFKFSL